jgi:hypothetical protein
MRRTEEERKGEKGCQLGRLRLKKEGKGNEKEMSRGRGWGRTIHKSDRPFRLRVSRRALDQRYLLYRKERETPPQKKKVRATSASERELKEQG